MYVKRSQLLSPPLPTGFSARWPPPNLCSRSAGPTDRLLRGPTHDMRPAAGGRRAARSMHVCVSSGSRRRRHRCLTVSEKDG